MFTLDLPSDMRYLRVVCLLIKMALEVTSFCNRTCTARTVHSLEESRKYPMDTAIRGGVVEGRLQFCVFGFCCERYCLREEVTP